MLISAGNLLRCFEPQDTQYIVLTIGMIGGVRGKGAVSDYNVIASYRPKRRRGCPSMLAFRLDLESRQQRDLETNRVITVCVNAQF